MSIKKNLLTTGLVTLLVSGVQGDIVYQDTFDAADGIDVNDAGVGGGLVSATNFVATGAPFADDTEDAPGDAVSQTAFGNRVAWAYTANQFELSGGFTLTVNFTTAVRDNQVTTYPSFTSNFGIVDEVTAEAPDENGEGLVENLNAYLFTDQADLNTVGFSAANRPDHATVTDPGIYTDFGTLTSASTDLNAAIVYGTMQSFSMTVNADGSASFSLDAASGSLPAGSMSSLFDDSIDKAYHFVAYSQGNTGLILHDVTIDAVGASASDFAITAIDYSPEANTVTLTWTSSPSDTYIAKFTSDLPDDWAFDMGDGISMAEDDEITDDGDFLTRTFSLEEFDIENETRLFFRIEEE